MFRNNKKGLKAYKKVKKNVFNFKKSADFFTSLHYSMMWSQENVNGDLEFGSIMEFSICNRGYTVYVLCITPYKIKLKRS